MGGPFFQGTPQNDGCPFQLPFNPQIWGVPDLIPGKRWTTATQTHTRASALPRFRPAECAERDERDGSGESLEKDGAIIFGGNQIREIPDLGVEGKPKRRSAEAAPLADLAAHGLPEVLPQTLPPLGGLRDLLRARDAALSFTPETGGLGSL